MTVIHASTEADRTRRAEWRNTAQAMRALLFEKFPHCFRPKHCAKQPLALGIHKQIGEFFGSDNDAAVAIALFDYTTGPTYLRALVEEAPRVGLDGEKAGNVTAGEAKNAADHLAALQAYWSAKSGDEKIAALAEIRRYTGHLTKRLRSLPAKAPAAGDIAEAT